MENKLDNIYKYMDVTSIDKLDFGYIHVIGKTRSIDINFITNDTLTLECDNYSEVKVIRYQNIDYLISENYFLEYSLVRIHDQKRLIKKARNINYIKEGLLEIDYGKYGKKIYNLDNLNYISIPDNMYCKSYENNLLLLKSTNNNQSKAIDRDGYTIISPIQGNIDIIDNNKFILNQSTASSIIGFNKEVYIDKANYIIQFNKDRIGVLKDGTLFILNNKLEILKNYEIGIKGRPSLIGGFDNHFIMSFTIAQQNYKTIFINLENDKILSGNFSLSSYLIQKDFVKICYNDNSYGIMNQKTLEILIKNCKNVEALNDSNYKYFFITQNNQNYIYNAQSNNKINVPYTEINSFCDGVCIAMIEDKGNVIKYHIIDENLKVLFELTHMGHNHIYYDHGILCYHSGNWARNYDAYTIIDDNSNILMNNKKSRVHKNNFNLLEINDESGKTQFFNFKTREFINLKLEIDQIDNKWILTNNIENIYSLLSLHNNDNKSLVKKKSD